jgi:hypothetical protein
MSQPPKVRASNPYVMPMGPAGAANGGDDDADGGYLKLNVATDNDWDNDDWDT